MNDKMIVLVEDNQDDEELACLAFERSKTSCRLVVLRDGQEAIDYFFGSPRDAIAPVQRLPKAILLDLKLPKVEGLEVLRRLRADSRTRPVPVVILTSSREETDLIESYDRGANSYVRKPVDFQQFVGAIEQLQMYWVGLNEEPVTRR